MVAATYVVVVGSTFVLPTVFYMRKRGRFHEAEIRTGELAGVRQPKVPKAGCTPKVRVPSRSV